MCLAHTLLKPGEGKQLPPDAREMLVDGGGWRFFVVGKSDEDRGVLVCYRESETLVRAGHTNSDQCVQNSASSPEASDAGERGMRNGGIEIRFVLVDAPSREQQWMTAFSGRVEEEINKGSDVDISDRWILV